LPQPESTLLTNVSNDYYLHRPITKSPNSLFPAKEQNAPSNPSNLVDGILEIVTGTSHAESLLNLQQDTPQLHWSTNDTLDTDSLLYLVNERD